MTDFNRIPEELRDLRQWVCWRYETKPGKTKPTKVPVNAKSSSGKHASSTDPSTWSSFAKAVTRYENGYSIDPETDDQIARQPDGIGFVFTEGDPYIGIDFDEDYHELFGQHPVDMAEIFGSYAEFSPSGNGVHVIGIGNSPDGDGHHPRGVGAFPYRRFFTMTGDIIRGQGTIANIQYHLDHYWPIWFPERPKSEPPPLQWVAGDDEVLHRLQNASNSDKFLDLYDAGNVSRYADNESEADLALCSMISFYTQDTAQIDRIFRASALYREKWERKDYRDMTISRALERSEFYDPGLNSPNGSFTYKNSSTSRVVDLETGEIDPESDDPDPEITIFNPTDLGNARRMVHHHGSELRYCETRAKWLLWNTNQWAWDDTGAIMQIAKAVIPEIHAEAVAAPSQKQQKMLFSWAKTSESGARIREMVRLSQDELPVRIDRLDANPWVLNVENGVIDLRSGDLLAHDPDHLITKIAPVSYDPDAQCPVWKHFLDEVMLGDTDLITFLHRSLGYSLTGSTRERAVFFLYGVGRNGKSTFLETVSTILGDYAVITPATTITAKRGDEGIPNDIARLSNIRFTSTSETGEFDRLNEAKIKAMSGEETMTARFLHGEYFDFRPAFKLWLGTNHKPIVRGTDDAIWDRIKLVPFAFRVDRDRVDHTLKDRLLAERSGILTWMVRGCLDWQKHGLGEPVVVRDATSTYRDEMDPIGIFITEECIRSEGASESATSLYQSFREWSEANGERSVMSQRMFGMRLKDRGYVSRKHGHRNAIHYFGLRLKLGSDTDHPVYDHIEESY